MVEFIDISLPISPNMVVWPGAPKTEFQWRRSMKKGDQSNNSNFFMNSHSGTHIDAPLHFFSDGKSVDRLALEILLGPAFLFDFSQESEVTVSGLEKCWPKKERVTRLLLKTRNSTLPLGQEGGFKKDFCALKETETRWLLGQGIQLIGIDGPSIQYFGDDPIVHQLFLEKEVVILEGLQLSEVAQGKYELLCLPLKWIGLEGVPARAILKKYQ